QEFPAVKVSSKKASHTFVKPFTCGDDLNLLCEMEAGIEFASWRTGESRGGPITSRKMSRNRGSGEDRRGLAGAVARAEGIVAEKNIEKQKPSSKRQLRFSKVSGSVRRS
ncbi:MAG: hypothetical protein C5B58_12030, partial [Acidobacteria bacterium]